MTSPDTPKSTSSPESADGRSQHEWPDGTTLDLFGAPPAHASHTRRLDLGAEPMIPGICGQTFIGCSVPPGPLSSWENRLRERLAMVGSTESALIWKPVDTPTGLSISRLAPSTLHSNGNASIGSGFSSRWPTAKASEAGPDFAVVDRPNAGGLSLQTAMPSQADPAHWMAPTKRDGKDTGGMATVSESGRDRLDQLPRQMTATDRWSTARASDGAKGSPNQEFSGGGTPLPAQKHAAPWPTATALDRPRTDATLAKSAAYRKAKANQATVPLYLGEAMERLSASWPIGANLSAWPTVTVKEGRNATSTRQPDSEHHAGLTLTDAICLNPTPKRWTAPAESDGRRAGTVTDGMSGISLAQEINTVATDHGGPEPSGSIATIKKRAGSPTPAHPCWLMGFEAAFLFTAPTASELKDCRAALRIHSRLTSASSTESPPGQDSGTP